jgi:phage-related protein
MREGYEEAKRFADENRIASEDVQRLGTDASRAGDDIARFAEENKLAIDGLAKLRDEAIEDGRALSNLRDHEQETATEAGHLRDEAVMAAESLAHLRDDAAEASHEVKKLGDQADETAAKLDLLGLSGASTGVSLFKILGIMGTLVGVAASVAPAFAAAGLGLGAFGLFAIPTLKSVASSYSAVSQAQQAVANATTAAQAKSAALQLANAWKQVPAPIAATVREMFKFKQEFASLTQKSGIQGAVLGDITQVFHLLSGILPTLLPLAKQGAVAVHNLLSALNTSVRSTGFISFMSQMSKLVVPAMAAIQHLAGALTGLLGHALEALAPLAVPLLNMLTSIVRALSGPLVSLLGVFQRLLFGLLGAIQPLIPGLAHLATILIGSVGSGLSALIPVITQVIQLLGPALIQILNDLMPLFENALTPNSPFMVAFQLLPALLRVVLPLITGLASLLSHPIFAQLAVDVLSAVTAFKAIVAILTLVSRAFGLLGLAFEATPVGWIVTAIAALVFAFYELWQHCAAFRNFWKGLWSDIQSAMSPVTSWIHNALSNMSRWWSDHGQQVMRVVHALWTVVTAVFKVQMAFVIASIKVGLNIIESAWRLTWDLVKNVFLTVWHLIRDIVVGIVQQIQHTILFFLYLIEGHWSAAWHQLQMAASAGMHMILNIIKDVTSGFFHLLYDAGRDIIRGLISGVESMIGQVWNLIKSIGSGISHAFSAVLHIFSPSQVFYEHGRNTMLGYINAVMDMMPMMKATMQQAASILLPPRLSPAALYGGVGVSAAAPSLAGVGGGGGGAAPGGSIIIQVDGKRLFEITQAELYRYNIRNSGQVTGVLKPV